MRQLKLFPGFWLLAAFIFTGCGKKPSACYSDTDFEKVPKIDVHFHYNSVGSKLIEYAGSIQMKLLSPNTDAGESIQEQLETTSILRQKYPGQFAFLGTFSVAEFGQPGFAEHINARIDSCMKAGAAGIKIWKNVGMVLKDSSGKYVMLDDKAFDPVFRYLEEHKIPVMGHLGEPKNCWLPEEKMTLENDRRYFREHPEYHMFLHPEAPSYEDQINARDQVLKNHPGLNFIGAHLGSLEWSVDELARRLDQFPNFNVDFAARIGHLQYQSSADREKVRNFLIRYQDRLLYGTDFAVQKNNSDSPELEQDLRKNWYEQWLYLATDSVVVVKDLAGKKVKGLQLPREVIDKIYFKNAVRIFGLQGF